MSINVFFNGFRSLFDVAHTHTGVAGRTKDKAGRARETDEEEATKRILHTRTQLHLYEAHTLREQKQASINDKKRRM